MKLLLKYESRFKFRLKIRPIKRESCKNELLLKPPAARQQQRGLREHRKLTRNDFNAVRKHNNVISFYSAHKSQLGLSAGGDVNTPENKSPTRRCLKKKTHKERKPS